MGLTYIEGKAIGNGGVSETVSFLVDSGANYTLLSKDTWEKLGLKAKKTLSFTLADGTKIRRFLHAGNSRRRRRRTSARRSDAGNPGRCFESV